MGQSVNQPNKWLQWTSYYCLNQVTKKSLRAYCHTGRKWPKSGPCLSLYEKCHSSQNPVQWQATGDILEKPNQRHIFKSINQSIERSTDRSHTKLDHKKIQYAINKCLQTFHLTPDNLSVTELRTLFGFCWGHHTASSHQVRPTQKDGIRRLNLLKQRAHRINLRIDINKNDASYSVRKSQEFLKALQNI